MIYDIMTTSNCHQATLSHPLKHKLQADKYKNKQKTNKQQITPNRRNYEGGRNPEI